MYNLRPYLTVVSESDQQVMRTRMAKELDSPHGMLSNSSTRCSSTVSIRYKGESGGMKISGEKRELTDERVFYMRNNRSNSCTDITSWRERRCRTPLSPSVDDIMTLSASVEASVSGIYMTNSDDALRYQLRRARTDILNLSTYNASPVIYNEPLLQYHGARIASNFPYAGLNGLTLRSFPEDVMTCRPSVCSSSTFSNSDLSVAAAVAPSPVAKSMTRAEMRKPFSTVSAWSFDLMPDEVIVLLCFYLTGDDLSRMCCVNQRWNYICSTLQQPLWQELVLKKFGFKYENYMLYSSLTDWHLMYAKANTFLKNLKNGTPVVTSHQSLLLPPIPDYQGSLAMTADSTTLLWENGRYLQAVDVNSGNELFCVPAEGPRDSTTSHPCLVNTQTKIFLHLNREIRMYALSDGTFIGNLEIPVIPGEEATWEPNDFSLDVSIRNQQLTFLARDALYVFDSETLEFVYRVTHKEVTPEGDVISRDIDFLWAGYHCSGANSHGIRSETHCNCDNTTLSANCRRKSRHIITWLRKASKCIRVFDVCTGRQLIDLTGHSSNILRVRQSQNIYRLEDYFLASLDVRGEVRIWDSTDQRFTCIQVLNTSNPAAGPGDATLNDDEDSGLSSASSTFRLSFTSTHLMTMSEVRGQRLTVMSDEQNEHGSRRDVEKAILLKVWKFDPSAYATTEPATLQEVYSMPVQENRVESLNCFRTLKTVDLSHPRNRSNSFNRFDDTSSAVEGVQKAMFSRSNSAQSTVSRQSVPRRSYVGIRSGRRFLSDSNHSYTRDSMMPLKCQRLNSGDLCASSHSLARMLSPNFDGLNDQNPDEPPVRRYSSLQWESEASEDLSDTDGSQRRNFTCDCDSRSNASPELSAFKSWVGTIGTDANHFNYSNISSDCSISNETLQNRRVGNIARCSVLEECASYVLPDSSYFSDFLDNQLVGIWMAHPTQDQDFSSTLSDWKVFNCLQNTALNTESSHDSVFRSTPSKESSPGSKVLSSLSGSYSFSMCGRGDIWTLLDWKCISIHPNGDLIVYDFCPIADAKKRQYCSEINI